MSRKKPEWLKQNVKMLMAYCSDHGYPVDVKSPYQYRVFGAVAIVDIYPSRMVYRIWSIDGVEQKPQYHNDMSQQIDLTELEHLLERGWVTI